MIIQLYLGDFHCGYWPALEFTDFNMCVYQHSVRCSHGPQAGQSLCKEAYVPGAVQSSEIYYARYQYCCMLSCFQKQHICTKAPFLPWVSFLLWNASSLMLGWIRQAHEINNLVQTFSWYPLTQWRQFTEEMSSFLRTHCTLKEIGCGSACRDSERLSGSLECINLYNHCLRFLSHLDAPVNGTLRF